MKRTKCLSGLISGLAVIAGSLNMPAGNDVPDYRGNQFLAIREFGAFAKSAAVSGASVFTSPELRSSIRFEELVVSWNVKPAPGAWLDAEVRAVYGDRATKWYHLGHWSADTNRHPRESVPRQRDADGDVDTDTLKLNRAAEAFQLRFTLAPALKPGDLRLVGVCLTDLSWRGPELTANRQAWGKLLEVPERSQMAYPNGGVLCSPTTVSMILGYWSRQLGRPELEKDVPEIARAVFDANWDGTGNWVFNTAYAGGFEGMTSFVTRLSDVAELEDLIASGVPVGLSLCYNRLRGRGRDPSGHLVVCVGFTADGDPVINDPGTSSNVRKVFPRKNLIDAWAYSKNATYLICPDGRLPRSRFGHW